MSKECAHLQQLAASEIDAILAELPRPLAQAAGRLPVTFERRPSGELQADGVAGDSLGLFTGGEMADGNAVIPAQIILFLENLWEWVEGDVGAFRAEVRTTFLHELGHFLGLDEDDLWERGLE